MPTVQERIYIFDTTLRDGEQSPGCSMNLEEKLRMARQLEQLRVDVIEAGFPIASVGDFEAVQAIAKMVEHGTVAALSRAVKTDIDRAWEAVRHARKPRIHTFIATSDIHLVHKLKKTRQQVLSEAVWAVEYAKTLCNDVEFSCEDSSRSDIDFLCEIVEATIVAGATVINLPDTVGYSVPEEYGAMFRTIKERVSNINKVTLSAHCHNDLGLAVANSLAALHNGARQVECTINGIGERAGNAALEEIVMAIKTRQEKLGFITNVNGEEIYKSSKLLSSLTGMMVQRNKAIVGANAFAHEAGIHQDGVLKSTITYEIMTPQSVGIKHSMLVLGKHSGRHALKQRYSELGYVLSSEDLERAYKSFCALADQKKEIFDEDLVAILEDREDNSVDLYHLQNIYVSSGTNIRPTATIELKQGEQVLIDSATGDGPVDAAYKAIERITGVAGKLTEYSIKSVSLGHDAIGEVFVRVDFDGVLFNGRAVSTDVITGSVKAYLEALNRALTAKKRKGEQQKEEVKDAAVAV
ncbi:MAG: 2-isopropylmalate synthase [Ignavibacteriales bacterium]|nr:2-isopropylmalate synthase [Ignavibacteriales bacterium]